MSNRRASNQILYSSWQQLDSEPSSIPGIRVTESSPQQSRAARIRLLAGRATVDLTAFVGQRVTLARVSEDIMGWPVIAATEGRVVDGAAFGESSPALVPKGGRGTRAWFRQRVLHVVAGYGQVQALQAWLDAQMAGLPQPVTLDALMSLPDVERTSDRVDEIGLALEGEHCGVPGCRWFLTDYDREGGIGNGFLVMPANPYGLVSEHGSVYGRDLLGGGWFQVPVPSGVTFGSLVDRWSLEVCDDRELVGVSALT